MIDKVLVIADLCRGSQAANAYKLYQLITPVMKELGVVCDVTYSKINLIQDHDDYFQVWKESLLKKDYAHIDALNLNTNTAVVGFELPESDTYYLSSKGISWINIAIHPLRFLSDLHFEVKSSFDYDFTKHTASLGEIAFCVSNMKLKHGSWIEKPSESTLVIFGQTPFDKSVYFDNEFKLLNNYLKEIDELALRHKKVVYRPHPWDSCTATDALIIDRYKAQISSEIDVYRLFASGEISAACSISSSVITEAKEFGVAAIYLEPRARRFGFPINYSRLLDDCFFWKSFLKIERKISYLPISGSIPDNFLRETFAYWGYSTPHRNLINDVSLLSENFTKNELQLNKAITKAQQAEAKAQHSEAKAQQAEAALQAIFDSTSWKISGLLRIVGNVTKSSFKEPKAIKLKIKNKLKLLLSHAILYIIQRPKVKSLIVTILGRFPAVKRRLMQINNDESSVAINQLSASELANLTPRALRIYTDIKKATERK